MVGTTVVVAFIATALIRLFVLGFTLGSLGGSYYRAIAAGDGERAFSLLCPEAQRRTSVAALSVLAHEQGGVTLLNDSLRGTGPDVWPFSDDGVAGATLRVGNVEVTRYIEVHWDHRWLICPAPSTSLLGREPH